MVRGRKALLKAVLYVAPCALVVVFGGIMFFGGPAIGTSPGLPGLLAVSFVVFLVVLGLVYAPVWAMRRLADETEDQRRG